MITHKIEVAHESIVKQKLNWLLAIGIFIAGLGLGAFVTALPIAKTEIGEQNAAAPMVRDFPARPDLAEPERDAIEADVLAWPPRPTQFHIAENAGVSLDENALAEYHQSERDFTSIVTSRIEENALAAYHQSEWGLTSSAVLPIEADALAAYHQSEWGRTLSPVLPSAKNEIDADQDIGLMEFFSVPDETSRQRIEPGTLEALPNIDPADRKFFSPDYGAMSGGSKEAEVLPNIDPADRKFFSPGYGAQTTSTKRSEAVLPPIENKMGEWSAIWFLLK